MAGGGEGSVAVRVAEAEAAVVLLGVQCVFVRAMRVAVRVCA